MASKPGDRPLGHDLTEEEADVLPEDIEPETADELEAHPVEAEPRRPVGVDAAVATTPPPAETPRRSRSLNIVGARNWFFLASLLLIIPGIISMVTQGFLLGIDFAGGTEFFLTFQNAPSVSQVQGAVTSQGVSGVVQQTGKGTFIIRTAPQSPIQASKFESALQSSLGPIDPNKTQVNSVGPTVAGEIVLRALLGILVASIGILSYLAFRFRKVQGGLRSGLQFGGSALAALLHDVFLLTGVFSILGKGIPFLGWHGSRLGEVDQLFMTAVLTVVGFSVHDTIVVFDRMRENMLVAQRLSFEQVANLSIMQTAARSIITSFTVVLVLVSLLFFGGDTLRGFVLALLVGIISGTYSSIFNATPLLVVWRKLQPVR